MKFKQGQEFTYERSFTKEDVKGFIDLAHYTGRHHEEENQDGEVMIQGLLTATLPTSLGGQYDLLVYQMHYNLTKPVYTGDHIVCRIRVDQAEEKRGRVYYKLGFSCKNQKNQEVLSGYLKAIELNFD
ncbi:hypothetical protein [Urinicoccus massiliensis]|uniref:hypothetical protein n=1 Tax=Urinicoccus massiliensis TaxID=1723382 RepID=UPI0009318010|nr:hypothetical protein [Urinicoccus massiliensis]